MNVDQAQEIVVASMATTAVVTSASLLADDRLPGVTVIIGLGASAFLLSVGAQFAPDVAAGIAILIMLTDLFVFAGPLWRALDSLTAPADAGHNRKASQ